ncbi:hypothetical protein FS815_27470 [Agrobacterium vitis]|uniref:hypothetical protein n=1 Tax=Allorhizobium ampelinum TaxID=3025782 RepID=UPI001F2D1419|nr:hypothetical protein [Allorhizobium ampelinum]MCF1450516.1 hypothetical protein [Allorhizobium ampelinum]
MKMKLLSAIALLMIGHPAQAAPDINKDYIRSLAAPGKMVLVIEYYDGAGNVVSRKGYSSPTPFQAASPTDIKVNDSTSIKLYGLKPCDGEFVNRRDDYAGSCDAYAKDQLAAMLKGSKVVFCRAFMTEANAGTQNATCFSYTSFPGSMDSVDMIEEQLVSLGAVTVTTKADGSPVRPDLANAQKIAVEGAFGMWADPRTKKQ